MSETNKRRAQRVFRRLPGGQFAPGDVPPRVLCLVAQCRFCDSCVVSRHVSRCMRRFIFLCLVAYRVPSRLHNFPYIRDLPYVAPCLNLKSYIVQNMIVIYTHIVASFPVVNTYLVEMESFQQTRRLFNQFQRHRLAPSLPIPHAYFTCLTLHLSPNVLNFSGASHSGCNRLWEVSCLPSAGAHVTPHSAVGVRTATPLCIMKRII